LALERSLSMALEILKDQEYRHKTEPTWPTIIVKSIHAEPDASFAGVPLKPYAYVEWQDNRGIFCAHLLSDIERNWEPVA
jgi:hypothetical protein